MDLTTSEMITLIKLSEKLNLDCESINSEDAEDILQFYDENIEGSEDL
jgi:hypothetical protein